MVPDTLYVQLLVNAFGGYHGPVGCDIYLIKEYIFQAGIWRTFQDSDCVGYILWVYRVTGLDQIKQLVQNHFSQCDFMPHSLDSDRGSPYLQANVG